MKHILPTISLIREDILEFQEIIFRLYGRKLTFEEAEDQLSRMVKLAQLVIETEDMFDINDHIENVQPKEQNVQK